MEELGVSTNPEEILELGKKLGVIDKKNEAGVFDRLKLMESCDNNGKEGGIDTV